MNTLHRSPPEAMDEAEIVDATPGVLRTAVEFPRDLRPSRIDGTPFDDLRADLAPRLDLTAFVNRLVGAHDDEEQDAAGAETDIDRVPSTPEPAHGDAIENPVASNPTVADEVGRFVTPLVALPRSHSALHPDHPHDVIPDGPRLARDRLALLEIVRFRILPFRDVHARIFGTLHKAVVTRRMQALERDGFITTWEERLVVGGHPRYAIPTKKGLDWALAELAAEARGLPHEKLVAFMRGADPRPLLLQPRTAPPFLPHQLETNRVVAALEAIDDLGITWASTWHRPLPNTIDHMPMPQPDAVLVATRDGKPHLVFLEHDRGQEAPASFARKKAERYYELSLYGLTEDLFGIDAFSVWVTVNDVAERKPLQRIRVLQGVSEKAAMMRFTLAGWIPGHGRDRPIWFTPSQPITATKNTPLAHAGLVGPFAGAHDAATMDSAADLLRRMRPSKGAWLPDEPFEE